MDPKKTVTVGFAGIWPGVFAYTAWGVLPLYWKLLDNIPALEILAHRILWSFVFTSIVLLATGKWQTLIIALADRRKLIFIFSGGCIISLNWFTYIFAVNNNHVLDASMGYYIGPLVVVLLGIAVLKEKLSLWQGLAVVLAAVGVLIITGQYGKIPWIALFLAVSFALYGLIKKLAHIDSITGLALETFIVMPVALIYIIILEARGFGVLGTEPLTTKLILVGTGVITAIPLFFFATGLRGNKFSMMGFLQYITPSLNLILGIYVFREIFTVYHLISFCFIWAALIVFTLAGWGVLQECKMKKTKGLKASKSA